MEGWISYRSTRGTQNGQQEASSGRAGEVVLIHEDGKKHGLWKMGILQEHIVGKDGHIQGANASIPSKSKNETITCSLHRLFLLEIAVNRACRERNGKERSKEPEIERNMRRVIGILEGHYSCMMQQ